MKSEALNPEAYIASLPADRQVPVARLREVIRQNIDSGFEEIMGYGMIGYVVPHSIYPAGYHCDPKLPLPFVSLASQKNYIAVYLMCVYTDPVLLDWFRTEYAKTGFKLDMGKSCVRFKKMDHIPYELIGELLKKVALKDYLAAYVQGLKR
jgi:hypothetical protein